MSNGLIDVGLDNMVAKEEIVAIARPDSFPVKRAIEAYKKENKAIDLTRGRKTRSVIFTNSGYVVLASLRTPTLAERYMSG